MDKEKQEQEKPKKQKVKLKTKLKIAGVTSPALAALIFAPAETFATLKMLKEAGFELPAIACVFGIAWWLRKDVIKIVDGRLGDLNKTVEGFGDKLDANTDAGEKRAALSEERWLVINERFLENDNKFLGMQKQLVTLETHIQGIMPSISKEELVELAEKVANENPDLTDHPTKLDSNLQDNKV